jgi:hypothetical protein
MWCRPSNDKTKIINTKYLYSDKCDNDREAGQRLVEQISAAKITNKRANELLGGGFLLAPPSTYTVYIEVHRTRAANV